MKRSGRLILCTGLGGLIIFICGIVLGWFGFPAFVIYKIRETVLLKNNTEGFKNWQKLPMPMDFKVYFFNVTNPLEVHNGANPIVQEVGPYVYDEYKEKMDIKEETNDTLSYVQNALFFFNKEKSGNLSEDDEVTLINVALVGATQKVQRMSPLAVPMMADVVPELFTNSETAFLKGSVRDFLWNGVTVINCAKALSPMAKSLCPMLRPHLPKMITENTPGIFKFSFFQSKNNSNDGRYRINRGLVDNHALGLIEEWNGEDKLDFWTGKSCNMINGTDSTIFHPFWSSKEDLYIFISDVCRSLKAEYANDETVNGVPTFRFVSSVHTLEDARDYSPNLCFCLGGDEGTPDERGCLKSGAIDLFTCQGAPAIVTCPHFYNASSEYLSYVEGLNPDKEKHETFVNLEPQTGVAVKGAKRLQLNVFLIKMPELAVFTNVSEGLFPAIWLEESATLDDDNIALLRHFYTMLTVLKILKWFLIGVGIFLVCISLCVCVNRRNERRAHNIERRNCDMVSYENKGYMHKPEDLNETFTIATINDIIQSDKSGIKKRKSDMFPGKSLSRLRHQTDDSSVGINVINDNKSSVTLSNVFM